MRKKSYLLITFLPSTAVSYESLCERSKVFPLILSLLKSHIQIASSCECSKVEGVEAKRVFFLRIANSNFIHSTALMQFFFVFLSQEKFFFVLFVCVCVAFKPSETFRKAKLERKVQNFGMQFSK